MSCVQLVCCVQMTWWKVFGKYECSVLVGFLLEKPRRVEGELLRKKPRKSDVSESSWKMKN